MSSSTHLLAITSRVNHRLGNGQKQWDDISSGISSTQVKPTLPPKPTKAPPPYRAPPRPPVAAFGFKPSATVFDGSRTLTLLPGTAEEPTSNKELEYQHCDSHMTTSTTTLNGQVSSTNRIPSLSKAFRLQKIKNRTPCKDTGHQVVRAQAWVQDQKNISRPISDKFGSFQQKLRSLLNHSPLDGNRKNEEQKESRSMSLPTPSCSQTRGNARSQSGQSAPQEFYVNHHNSRRPITRDHNQRESFIEALGKSETQCDKTEENSNQNKTRVACNKLFDRERTACWSSSIVANHAYMNMGHNLKSFYNYEKIVPKESIGKSFEERKPNCSRLGGATKTRKSSAGGAFEHLPCNARTTKQLETLPNIKHLTEDVESIRVKFSAVGGSYSYLKNVRGASRQSENDIPISNDTDPKLKSTDSIASQCTSVASLSGTRASEQHFLRSRTGTPSDQYKSSSESGRGTMHSGAQSFKTPSSLKSATPSTGSNLDTSVDSDHSACGVQWPNRVKAAPPYEATLDTETFDRSDGVEAEMKNIFKTPKPTVLYKKEKTADDIGFSVDGTCSESMSITPPLPPLSPHESSSQNSNSSSEDTPKAKYKPPSSATTVDVMCMKNSGISTKHAGNSRSMEITTYSTQKTGQCHPHGNGRLPTHLETNEVATSSSNRIHLSPVDAEVTSTTTGLDMESLLEDLDDYSSEISATTSNMENNDVGVIRKQLESLETMYSEVLRLLDLKHNKKRGLNPTCRATDGLGSSRRRRHDCMSSLTGRSSLSRGTQKFKDKRSQEQKRKPKESKTGGSNKRLQRLESHVVTLARSVAHLSSEIRTHHVLGQGLEALRKDVKCLQEQIRAVELSARNAVNHNLGVRAGRGQHGRHSREKEKFYRDFLEMTNPSRVQKLTKFFGAEPPLLRKFLKKLGYEKYAANFEQENIGIMELPYVTEERLQKIGVPMGPRMRIIKEIQMSFGQDQFKIYIV
ncbi:uncharacterized protein LOC106457160 isoform X2 [Limulus polyphemus]|nr:uncharacterized protein LOC106457160 isoform X2 [Limulus polyphemus]